MRISFHHKTEANLWKFAPYNIDGFAIISIKRVEEFNHDFPLQQYFATYKWSISLKMKEVEEAQSEKSDERGSPPSSLDDRLATLKRMKEQHLITEEDYQKKKQALLDQL